jgi:Cu2+-containing amine oxidase
MERIQRAGAGTHPLAPPSASELASATSILRAHERFATLGERSRFVTTAGFQLEPIGLFARNPALDVPPSRPHSDHCKPGSST